MRTRRRWRSRHGALALLAAVGLTTATLATTTSAAADGGPDPTLAGSGTLQIDWSGLIGEPANSYLGDVVRDDVGRWLVTGTAQARDNDPMLSVLQRLLPDGSPDPTFGVGGVVTSRVPGPGPAGSRLAVLPTGDIVLGDFVLTPDGAYRHRLTVPAAGILGIGGVVGLHPLPDGMLLVAGIAGDRGLVVATTNPNALALAGGQRLPLREPATFPTSVALATDASGRMFVTDCSTAASCHVSAFTPDGQTDAAYGDGGVVTLRTQRCSTAVAPDGFLVSACAAADQVHTSLDQFDPRGQLDDSFATVVVASADVHVQYDGAGRVGAAGVEFTLNGQQTIVRRFLADGALDTSFGTGGETATPFLSASELRAAPSGGLYVFGYAPASPSGPTQAWLTSLDSPQGTALQPPLAVTSRFVATAPTRLLDTRDAGTPAPAAGAVVRLEVAGHGPVPATGVTAAVLNVTATDAAGPGYVTVWPAGAARPIVSNLNLVHAGDTAANLVIVPLGAGGAVDIFTQSGTHLVADLAGWFEAADHATAGRFRSTRAPFRVLDTRDGTGAPAAKPGPGGSLVVHVTGAGGVPSSGVAAVVMNLTGTEATAAGYVTAWPADLPQPLASNLNLTRGDTRANLAIVPVSPAGDIAIVTQSGTHLVADIAGWFTDGSGADGAAGLFVAVPPRRMLDTRITGPLASLTVTRRIGGTDVVPPALAGAVVANVTATDATAESFVTAWPAGTDLPLVSTLNLPGAGWTVPNLAVVRLNDEAVSLYTQRPASVLIDVAGWFVADGAPAAPG